MRVTPIFPADAVPVNISMQFHSGSARYIVIQSEGNSSCFELCDYDPTNLESPVNEEACNGLTEAQELTENKTMILRYNPEKLCPANGVLGNKVPPNWARLRFWGAGDATVAKAAKNLSISVASSSVPYATNPLAGGGLSSLKTASLAQATMNEAFEPYSLYIGPVLNTLYYAPCTNVTTPQLWAVTNLKQTTSSERPRKIVIASRIQKDHESSLDAFFRLEFEAPGTQVFAFEPTSMEQLQIFEETLTPQAVEIARCNLNDKGDRYCFTPGGVEGGHFPNGLETQYLAKLEEKGHACPQASQCQIDCGDAYKSGYENCNTQLDTCIATQNYGVCLSEWFTCVQFARNIYAQCKANCGDETDVLDCVTRTNLLLDVYKEPGLVQQFLEQPIAEIIEDTRSLASSTAFWRGNKVTRWCDKGRTSCYANGVPKANAMDDNDCCRPTIDGWRNMTPKEIHDDVPCTFCNQTDKCGNGNESECSYTAPDAFQCDSRCQQVTGEEGVGEVDYGNSFNGNVCSIPTYLTATEAYTAQRQSISKAIVTACDASNICPLVLTAAGKPRCVADSNADGFAQAGEILSDSTDTGSAYSCGNNTIIAVSVLPSQNKVFKASVTACDTAYCGMGLDSTLTKPLCQNLEPATAEGDFYKCAAGQNIMTIGCSVPCANWCGEPNCIPACPPSCVYTNTTYGPMEQTGWLTKNNDEPQRYEFEASTTDEPFSRYWPYAYFPAYYQKTPFLGETGPSYHHSVLINTMGLSEWNFYEGLGLTDNNSWRMQGEVQGCKREMDAFSYQGLYDFQFGNEVLQTEPLPGHETEKADIWQGNVQAVQLEAKNQLGATQCRKGDDVASQELCAPVYADQNAAYGNCINSLWSLFAGENADEQCGDVLKTFLKATVTGCGVSKDGVMEAAVKGGSVYCRGGPDPYAYLYPSGVFETYSGSGQCLDSQHACNAVGKCVKGCG